MLQLIDNPDYAGYVCDREKLTVSIIKFNDRSLYTELFELDYDHPLERRRFELQYRLTTPLLDIPIEHGVRQFSVVKKGVDSSCGRWG